MRLTDPERVLMVLAALFSLSTVSIADGGKAGPHSDSGDCSICHVAPADKLRSWFALGSTKRELKHDLIKLCTNCHTVKPDEANGIAVGVGHATDKKPETNHQNLPLSNDGTINCATTCHNMHVTADDRRQQKQHLRLPVNSLCIACHDK
ncbi:MAG: cytochrome C [Deltaproteobacteria bacterium]|nr:cytochrome C [Deltaproteobacteria bacterium]